MKYKVIEYGSEFDFESNNKYINNNGKCYKFLNASYFRSGRDALRSIAISNKNKYRRILIPALCCESMVEPFRRTGYEIIYFKLNQNITADYNDILDKLQDNTLILYINYFGINSLTNEKLMSIKQAFKNIKLIEDRTHDILVQRDDLDIADYTVASIRKWLAIPDGGILYTRDEEYKCIKEQDVYFANTRISALVNKSKYLSYGNEELKKIFRSELNESNLYLEQENRVVDMNYHSRIILEQIDFEKIFEDRKYNVKILLKLLQEVKGIKNIYKHEEQSNLYYPILVENRDKLQSVLALNNIYCPVIWPLPKDARGVCNTSDYISDHMLAIPCDQRYEQIDMEHICRVLMSYMEDN